MSVLAARIRAALERIDIGDFHDPGDVLGLAAEAADRLDVLEDALVRITTEGTTRAAYLEEIAAEALSRQPPRAATSGERGIT